MMLTRLKSATNKNIAPREKGGAEREQRTDGRTDGRDRKRRERESESESEKGDRDREEEGGRRRRKEAERER